MTKSNKSNKSNKLTPEIQEEIQNQVDDHVVLYNIKDKNAFFIISPEEARYALDIIKERRTNSNPLNIDVIEK